MRVVFVDVKNNIVREASVNDLEDYYRLIDCRCIDIVNREIDGKRYDIVCDDEALLKNDICLSAVDMDGNPMLIGNLIVAGEADENGELTDLTDDDITHIKGNIYKLKTVKNVDGNYMVYGLKY